MRLKGSSRVGVVTSLNPRGAHILLRPADNSSPRADAATIAVRNRNPVQFDAAAAGNANAINAVFDDIVLRFKGAVIATRALAAAAPASASAAPPPLPSYDLHVRTDAGDVWVEPLFVAMVLKPQQMQTFDTLTAMSSSPASSEALQLACARGDASVLQVTRRRCRHHPCRHVMSN